MSFTTILYTLLIKPLQLIFEVVYSLSFYAIGNHGISIILLSLAINFLVLPLYNRADAIQEEERLTEAKLNKWVTHIKKTFKGDERTMMLQTYYRQNNYNPLYSLRSAVSLMLEIPFFIAAYNFLSNLSLLKNVPFGPIDDLSKPDGILTLFGVSINILPFIMTGINLISSAIFTKDAPTKTKVQLYVMALFFLVFLYNSPAGLVFYWSLNNLFSLIKTILYKLGGKNLLTLSIFAILGGFCLYAGVSMLIVKQYVKGLAVVFISLILFMPLIYAELKNKKLIRFKTDFPSPNKMIFLSTGIFISVFIGTVIPSQVIKSSPQEFIVFGVLSNPVSYVFNTLLLSLGFFVIWSGVFYWLFPPKAKVILEFALLFAGAFFVVDYLFFGTDLGVLSSDLIYNHRFNFNILLILTNLSAIVAVGIVILAVFVLLKKYISRIVCIIIAVCICMSTINCVNINNSVKAVATNTSNGSSDEPTISLSKTSKNVVVIILDRAMGEYVPYIMKEKPELKEKFSGFTYYNNVVSFGGYTNFATPAVFGGYEYTPIEINKRKGESLSTKHDEALKVLPVLFEKSGFNTSVFDLPYAGNYSFIPDLSIFNDYKNISKFNISGYFSDKSTNKNIVSNRKRNFFFYSLMKSSPLCVQYLIYNSGNYLNADFISTSQIVTNESVARGINSKFSDNYETLSNLGKITGISNDKKGSFVIMSNDTTHEPTILQAPDYEPTDNVDNTKYNKENTDRFIINGKRLSMVDEKQTGHYCVNIAAFLQLGKWFDQLKSEGVYDNTRIIVASDHGRDTNQIKDLVLDNSGDSLSDLEYFYPLLMVKDFGATEFTTSSEFMTTADIATLATDKVINSPKNPFTGKEINNKEKYSHDQYILASEKYDVNVNNGNQFMADRWYSVSKSIWDKNNWKKVADYKVLDDYVKN